ncbi:MAG: ABC transporter permease [Desulfovibrio sp.]|jgi:phospholipid/cholesterol/gamma-HCH transport system permease protein|nr:ABC transporter permease [Desulfovibrio sp.]
MNAPEGRKAARASGSESVLASLGRYGIALTGETGAMGIFLLRGISHMFRSASQIPKVLRQVRVIGAESLFLIVLIGLFTGMVLGLQGYYTLTMFGSEGFLGSAVSLSLIRELGPVLTAIMIAGRAGSAMAAEIGVMRISDQIDALEVMDINPMAYLVSPRLTAALVAFPLLTSVFCVVGILGGYATGVLMLGVSRGVYFSRIESSVRLEDVAGCLTKSLVFALVVAAVCCYKGYFAHMRRDGMGAEAVGNATTSAVVLSCILLLAADYVLTSFLL